MNEPSDSVVLITFGLKIYFFGVCFNRLVQCLCWERSGAVPFDVLAGGTSPSRTRNRGEALSFYYFSMLFVQPCYYNVTYGVCKLMSDSLER